MRTRTLEIATDRDTVDAKLANAGSGPTGVLLAHGAGVGQDHEWMTTMRSLIASHGYPVMTFNYAYTAQGRKAPDRMPRLLEVHQAAADRLAAMVDVVVLAGKSMGSRVGAHLADQGGVEAAGLVHYGYPLVPMGRGEPRPTDHLERLPMPQLFFAGTRDRLSPPVAIGDLIARLPAARLEVIEDADHSFRMPKRAPMTTEEALEQIAATTAAWIGSFGQPAGGR